MRVENDTIYRPKTFSYFSHSQYQLEKTQFEFEDMRTCGSAAMSISDRLNSAKMASLAGGAKYPLVEIERKLFVEIQSLEKFP